VTVRAPRRGEILRISSGVLDGRPGVRYERWPRLRAAITGQKFMSADRWVAVSAVAVSLVLAAIGMAHPA
jgi:hypothetical protein